MIYGQEIAFPQIYPIPLGPSDCCLPIESMQKYSLFIFLRSSSLSLPSFSSAYTARNAISFVEHFNKTDYKLVISDFYSILLEIMCYTMLNHVSDMRMSAMDSSCFLL